MHSATVEDIAPRTAVMVSASPGQVIIEIDGKLHSLRRLLGVDSVVELTGDEALEYLKVFQTPALSLV